MPSLKEPEIKTDFSTTFGLRYPIINAPMFLVSDEELIIASAKAGIMGAYPSLNWRTTEKFREALKTTRNALKGHPFGVNLIVNKSNLRVKEDLKACIDEGVPFFITSLGSPKEVIAEAKKIGAKVYCDVTTLDYAKKVQDLGADGVIAVCSGAGGHAGPISPLVLVPYLKKNLQIPIVLAGGVSDGRTMAAALLLGASAVQVGTRFIASTEAKVDAAYKDAIVASRPEDIVMTTRISGTPAAVINTPYIEKMGLHLNPLEKFLSKNAFTKKWAKVLIYMRGSKMLENAAQKTTWKSVWSAGQGVGLVDSVESVGAIVDKMGKECAEVLREGAARLSETTKPSAQGKLASR